VAKVVEPGESGYSDLAVGPDGMIYLAYERGGTKGEKVFSPRYLSFARFDLGWVEGK
jgi:sialidase-1